MSNETTSIPDSDFLSREQFRQKIFAFVITACSSFVLLALFWPISVQGFSSNTRVMIEVGDSESAQKQSHKILTETIRKHASSERLTQLIDRVRTKTGLFNDKLADLDLDSVRQSLSVKVVPTKSMNRVQLEFAYHGNGTADERAMVRLLADDLTSSLLNSMQRPGIGMASMATGNATRQLRKEISDLEGMVSQIKSDLTVVRESVSELVQRDASPFHNASHTSAAPATLEEINQSIDSIDMESVRIGLTELKSKAGQSDLFAQSNHLPVPCRIKTEPIGGVPRKTDLIWIGMFAIALGSVIAVNYRPFDGRGFENVSHVASILKIPVLTALPKNVESVSFDNDETLQSKSTHWANQVVVFARLLLFGLIVLVIGFCLVNESVRTAFLANPLHGFARMVWMFSGR
jgi:hypothetical protein